MTVHTDSIIKQLIATNFEKYCDLLSRILIRQDLNHQVAKEPNQKKANKTTEGNKLNNHLNRSTIKHES